MNNLNSRQKEKKRYATKKKERKKQERLKIQVKNKFDNEVEYFLVLNEHFQVEVEDFLVQAK
jgi:hypothetical protein